MKVRINLDSGEKLLSELFLYIFAITTIVVQIQDEDTFFFRVRFFAMIAAAIIGVFLCVKYKFYKPIEYACLFACLWGICFLMQRNPNSDLEKIIYTLLYIGMAMILVTGYDSVMLSRLIAYILFAYMIYQMLIGRSFRTIILSSSYNYISILLLFAMMFYYIALLNKGKDISLLFALVYFVVCTWAYGRGGIVAASFLCIALLIKKIVLEESKLKKRGYILLAIAIVICSAVMLNNGTFFETFFQKFTIRGTTDEARLNMWSSFFSNNQKDIISFLFGSDTALVRSDHNLHNFLLQSYATFGLLGFLVLIYLIISSFIRLYRQRKIDHMILFMFLLIRASTDRVFFQGYSEIFLFFFLMYPHFVNKTNRISSLS